MNIIEERRRGFDVHREQRTIAPLLGVWLAGMLVLWLVASGAPSQQVQLLLDPAAGELPWYVGLVAKLGALGWCVGAVAGFAGGHAARLGGRRGATSFLTGGGLLLTLLLVDDLFQLHSAVLPKVLPGPKVVVIALLGLAIAVWVGANLRELARTRWRLLLAGGVGLFGSAAVDVALAPAEATTLFLEDGLKFLGILTIAGYFVVTAADVFRSVLFQAGLAATVVAETDDDTDFGDSEIDDTEIDGFVLSDLY